MQKTTTVNNDGSTSRAWHLLFLLHRRK